MALRAVSLSSVLPLMNQQEGAEWFRRLGAEVNIEGKKVAYPFVALFAACLETLGWALEVPIRLPGVVLAVLLLAAIITIPWRPVVGQVTALGAVALLLALPESYVGQSFLPLSVILLIADQLSRTWWWAVVGTELLIFGVNLAFVHPGDVARTLLACLFLSAIAVPVGIAMWIYRQQIHSLERELTEATRQARLEIAVSLHDTVMTDLSKILMTVRALQRSEDSKAFETELALMEHSARTSSMHLRGLAAFLDDSAEQHHATLSTIISEGRALLRLARCRLVDDLPPEGELRSVLGQLRYDFSLLFLREGIINCTKYCQEGTTVRIWAEISADQVEFALISDVKQLAKKQPEESLTSLKGLINLQRRAESIGADVVFGEASGRWLHSLRMPLDVHPSVSEERDRLRKEGDSGKK